MLGRLIEVDFFIRSLKCIGEGVYIGGSDSLTIFPQGSIGSHYLYTKT